MTLALPARDLMIALNECPGLSARNSVPAVIREIRQNGHAVWVDTETRVGELIVEMTADAWRELALQPGLAVRLIFKTHSVSATSVTKTKPEERTADGERSGNDERGDEPTRNDRP